MTYTLSTFTTKLLAEAQLYRVELDNPKDESAFGAMVKVLRSENKSFQNMDDYSIWKRLLRLFQDLGKHKGGGTGLTASDCYKMVTILTHLGSQAGWTSQSGPILGCRNEVIEIWLGRARTAINTLFKNLRRAGMIMFHNVKGNHARRWSGPNSSDKNAGYSFLPVIMRLEYLEEIVRDLDDHVRAIAELKHKTKTALNNAYQTLKPFIEDAIVDEKLEQLGFALISCRSQRDALRRSTNIDELSMLTQEALRLERAVNSAVSTLQISPKTEHRDTENRTPKELQQETDSVQVFGSQEERSGNGSASRNRSCNLNEANATDPYHLTECGIDAWECPTLFPALAHLSDRANWTRSTVMEVAHRMSSALRINPHLWSRARDFMGAEEASYAVLITAQKHADQQIRETPGHYLNGMLRKAMAGELNLGKTIWGLRDRSSLAV